MYPSITTIIYLEEICPYIMCRILFVKSHIHKMKISCKKSGFLDRTFFCCYKSICTSLQSSSLETSIIAEDTRTNELWENENKHTSLTSVSSNDVTKQRSHPKAKPIFQTCNTDKGADFSSRITNDHCDSR